MKTRRPSQSWGVGRLVFLIGFTALFTGLGIYQVNRQYDVVARGYRVDRELFDVRMELETRKRLSLLLSAHRNPNTLRTVALEELGMELPSRDSELFVPSGPPPDAEAMPVGVTSPDGPGAP